MGKRRPMRAGRLLRGRDLDPRKANAIRLKELAHEPPVRQPNPPHPDAPTTKYRSRLVQVAAGSFDAVRPLIALLHKYQAIAEAAIAQEDRADEQDPEDDAPPRHRPEPKGKSPDDLRVVAQNRRHEKTASGALVQPLFLPGEIATEIEIMRKRLVIYRDNLPVDGIAGQAADMLEKWRVGVDLRMLQGLGIQPIKDKSALAEARDQIGRAHV